MKNHMLNSFQHPHFNALIGYVALWTLKQVHGVHCLKSYIPSRCFAQSLAMATRRSGDCVFIASRSQP